MANYTPLIGMQPLAGTLQAPLVSVSKAVETIAEEFALDPALPVLGEIMTDGRVTYVTVPKFRAVGMKSRVIASNNAGARPTLTIATGTGAVDPIGVAQFDLYKEYNNIPQGMQSVFERRQYIRFPFINGTAGDAGTTYNSNLNGSLFEGASVAPDAYGRPSLYVPRKYVTATKKVTVANGATDAIALLASGFNPNIPRSVAVLNLTKGIAIPSSAINETFTDDVEGAFSITVDSVVGNDTVASTDDILLVTLEYGHTPQKRYGTVCRVLTGVDEHTLAGHLRSQVNGDYPLAPVMNPVFTVATSVTITPGASNTSGVASLGYKFIDLSKPVTVSYCADITAQTPVWVTLDDASMPRLYAQREVGTEFALYALGGELEWFLDGRAVTANTRLKVDFSYKIAQNRAQFEMAAYGNQGTGIYGQTDGSIPGTVPVMKPAPAVHPDGAALKAMNAANIRLSGIMHIMID